MKRGSVEDQGEDRGRLLTEVEQLVSSGDNTIVSIYQFCCLTSFGIKWLSEIFNLHVVAPKTMLGIVQV